MEKRIQIVAKPKDSKMDFYVRDYFKEVYPYNQYHKGYV